MKPLFQFGPFVLDPNRRVLRRGAETVPLTPKAFDLLLYLAQHPNRVITKEELLQGVWGDGFVEEGNITQNVFLLRRAMAEESGPSALIVTLPRKGYQFAAVVATLPETVPMAIDEELSKLKGNLIVQDVQTLTHIVVEEETEFPDSQLKALPAVAKPRWGRILLLILAGAVAGALAVWAFFAPRPMPRVLRAVQLTRTGRAEPYGSVLTDGSRLFFTERIGGAWSLAQTAEQGGEPTLIPSSVIGITLLDIDHTRSKFLVRAQGPDSDSLDPIWVVATGGGSAQRLGDVRGVAAAWSPDGQSVAYSQEGELFIVRVDGQQTRKLFSAAGTIPYLRWSPDGKRLSLTVMDATGTRSLWEIAPDGSKPHPLDLGWKSRPGKWGEGDCCGEWTPDGKFFVFRSAHDEVESLWAIREDGRWFRRGRGRPVQLYTSPDRIGEPRFSADGRKIFFVDYQERRELVRYDSARKLFVPYLNGIPARFLSFSRDGHWVSYRNDVGGNLWRSRPDGSEALQLTFPPLEVRHSTWSPDGKTIVFEADGILYTIPSEGGKPEVLLTANATGIEPVWSPDGRYLLFSRFAKSEAGYWQPSIFQMDFNTRQVQMVPGSEDFEDPVWSPDGKYVAVADRKDKKLALFDVARRQWSELADGIPYGWGIRWSADGRYVYYQHMYSGEEQPIFRVRLSDHVVEQVTSSREIVRADILSYSMIGLAPDDSPLASLLRRNSDVYALELDLP
jgi:Tol biopolymer transport system component/DNA-binding winged helix-turn-helix (wHTH) protein